MKSLTKSIKSKSVVRDVHAQFSLRVAGVLQDAQSAFFGLCVNAGKAVLGAMMEAERTGLCGPKGVPDCQRAAYRGGHTRSSVTLGGRRITIARPRAQLLEAGEVALPTFTWAQQRDPLDAATIAAIAAGVSTAAVEACMPIAQQSGHRVEVELSPVPLPMNADGVRIEQILSNLINNAAKFTPAGGRIAIRIYREDAAVGVTVNDTGIGIAPDRIDDMFNPFTQGAQTLARSSGGLGIGLTIARRVASLHGGTLTATSAGHGLGATFRAQFPLLVEDQPAVDGPAASSARPNPKRVLVVDDNADIRDSLGMLLEMWG